MTMASILRHFSGPLLVLSSGMLLSCGLGQDDSAKSEQLARAPQTLISDELHNARTHGFAFLPPLVPAPADFGDFLPDVPVMVRIDELSAAGATVRSLATFTRNSGPEGEHLRVHHQGSPCDGDDNDGDADSEGYFYARWRTDDAHLTPSARYRVRVLVPSSSDLPRELGFADVDVVTTTREFRSVDKKEYTPLLNGTTVRIKFRVDWPAVDRDHDGVFDWLDNCPTLANPDQTDTLQNGIGDACRCARVRCVARDSCHVKGVCEPTTGTCTNPPVYDGATCVLPHATASCQGGVCQLDVCHNGHGDCNADPSDGCETRTTTTANCGGCGNVCSEGPNSHAVCRHETCGQRCSRGYADCDGDPTSGCEQDILSDAANCGACGNLCVDQQGCARGACTTAVCQDGYADCDSSSVDGCEINIATDANNCGACARVCEIANGSAGCAAEACTVSACNDGYADCNLVASDGCEVEYATDIANCGSCGSLCTLPHATTACVAGSCILAQCTPGFADCDGDPGNGCEVDLNADTTNCGSCGNACALPQATSTCSAGACAVGACAAGFADCNGLPTDGCEVNSTSDVANCGSCASACASLPNAQSICSASACGLSCNAGFADCDGIRNNGCEADVQGTCGVCSCPTPAHTVTGECNDGACGYSVCEPGYADCDGNAVNGCEVNVGADLANCGACGSVCTLAHASSTCAAGTCLVAECATGFADCNGSASDGCEVNFISDPNNCGSCNNVCAAGTCYGYYRDYDGDGYGASDSLARPPWDLNFSTGERPPLSIGLCDNPVAPSGYAPVAGDCCDADASAFSGQTKFFAFPNACGKWDFNCDGIATTDLGPTYLAGQFYDVIPGCQPWIGTCTNGAFFYSTLICGNMVASGGTCFAYACPYPDPYHICTGTSLCNNHYHVISCR